MPSLMLKNMVLMSKDILPKKRTDTSWFKEVSSKKSGGKIPRWQEFSSKSTWTFQVFLS